MARSKVICSEEHCGKNALHKGLCSAHYQRLRTHGTPTGGSTAHGEPREFLDDVLKYAGDDCVLWPYASVGGYGRIYRDGKVQPVTRLICEALYGPSPTAQHQAAHKCGNGHLGCVTPGHLRWATVFENHKDKIGHGTHGRGERSPAARLTEAQVREIRSLRGVLTLSQIAQRFGISKGYVSLVHTKRRWAWLE